MNCPSSLRNVQLAYLRRFVCLSFYIYVVSVQICMVGCGRKVLVDRLEKPPAMQQLTPGRETKQFLQITPAGRQKKIHHPKKNTLPGRENCAHFERICCRKNWDRGEIKKTHDKTFLSKNFDRTFFCNSHHLQDQINNMF